MPGPLERSLRGARSLPRRVLVRRRHAPEPTSRLPLRSGTYDGRVAAGLFCMAVGTLLIQQVSVTTLGLGILGAGVHIFGWGIVPGPGWARALGGVLSMCTVVYVLSSPRVMWLLAIPLLCWLLVRMRPIGTWVVLAVPLATGGAVASVARDTSDRPWAFLVTTAGVVLGAVLAREMALRVTVLRRPVALQPGGSQRVHKRRR